MSQIRSSLDEYYMGIAISASARSTCDKAIVGATIVSLSGGLSTGYNGAPRGLPHCSDHGHLLEGDHCVRTVHAEINALLRAGSSGLNVVGATCYVTHFPCFSCAKALINAGIARIVYKEPYRMDPNAMNFLEASGVRYDRIVMQDPTLASTPTAIVTPIEEDPFILAEREMLSGVTVFKSSGVPKSFVLYSFKAMEDGRVKVTNGSRWLRGYNNQDEDGYSFDFKSTFLTREAAINRYHFLLGKGFRKDPTFKKVR